MFSQPLAFGGAVLVGEGLVNKVDQGWQNYSQLHYQSSQCQNTTKHSSTNLPT